MAWELWITAIIVMILVLLVAFSTFQARKFGYRMTTPIVTYRPLLRTLLGDKVVAGHEQIGEDYYRLIFEDGRVLNAHANEIKPLHPIETMCRNNTPGGRDMWVYRPVLSKHLNDIPTLSVPTVDEFERLMKKREKEIADADAINNEVGNREEKQELDIKQTAELSKATAPRMSRPGTGGLK